MSFSRNINNCFVNYAKTSGRASRSEFWYFFIFIFAVSTFFTFIDFIISENTYSNKVFFFTGLSGLLFFFPFVTVSIRRLHDLDKSGSLMVLWVVPLIGPLLLLVLFLLNGNKGPNRFGERPD